MKTLIMIATALLLSSCASFQDGRSLDRVVKVCAYNALFNWISSGTGASSFAEGDAKQVLDLTTKYRIVEGVCYENENTIKEDL